MPFNRSMTFPTEMTLRKVDDRWQLCAAPVRELAKLQRNPHVLPDFTVDARSPFTLPLNRSAYDVSMTVAFELERASDAITIMSGIARAAGALAAVSEPEHASGEAQGSAVPGFILSLFGWDLTFDATARTLRSAGCAAPIPGEGAFSLRVLADVNGFEVFADGGSRWMSMGCCADWNLDRLSLCATGGLLKVSGLKAAALDSIRTDR